MSLLASGLAKDSEFDASNALSITVGGAARENLTLNMDVRPEFGIAMSATTERKSAHSEAVGRSKNK
jgi:hypothetical protein